MEASASDREAGSDAPAVAAAAPDPSHDVASTGDPQDAQTGEPGDSGAAGRGRALSEEDLSGAVLGAVPVEVKIPDVVVAAAGATGSGASAGGVGELERGVAQQNGAGGGGGGGGGGSEGAERAETARRTPRPPPAPTVTEVSAAAAAVKAAAAAERMRSANAQRLAAAKAAVAAVPTWQNLPLVQPHLFSQP